MLTAHQPPTLLNSKHQLRASLLDWYDKNHRIFPWRRNSHSQLPQHAIDQAAKEGTHPAPPHLPLDRFIYYVWVCEIMAQTTHISRVCEYFKKWVVKWPDVNALASATQEEVNDMWAGLGYYRRARYLLDGAKFIVHDCRGQFPRTAKELQKIPGIGAYTSNAIASIACEERVAVVDGNVIRVLARLRRLGGDTKSTGMGKLFADLAQQALDPGRPGDFNQAVMELGATVCVPNTRPNCSSCPVSSWCLAHVEEKKGRGSVMDYPAKAEKAEKREESVAVAVVKVVVVAVDEEEDRGKAATKNTKRQSKFLLTKRPAGGLLAGLWEFPLRAVKQGASLTNRQSVVDTYLNDLGVVPSNGTLKVKSRKVLGDIVHVFSHIRMTMHVESVEVESEDEGIFRRVKSENDDEMQWLNEEELKAAGLSSGVKKVYALYCSERDKMAEKKKTPSIARFFIPKKNTNTTVN